MPGLTARMLRSLCALVLWVACAPAFAQADLAAIPKLDRPVVDTTGTLDATQVSALDQQARALQQRKGSQLQVLMVPTTQPETIEQYTVRAFEQYKLGRKGVDDGVLLIVARDNPSALRRLRIEAGRGVQGVLTDAQSKRVLQDVIAPHFARTITTRAWSQVWARFPPC